ncbi:BspA family leucine-rich repeat surface protein [Campylobacter devanensis]|uniref:BspA family leucine-rich repeat surface protein n=1 Tax=Campylobacter devanensis TaxID=3161138 RepID=UPI00191C8BDB|nr:BspA family leucine-rich repeat surface protein [Campylobacter sp. P159]
MAEMKTEQKDIMSYLSGNKFLIPIFQRPYAWTTNECEQLWNDIVEFFLSKGQDDDDDDKQYFLGSIVMYKQNKEQHVIDGQQRTTTLMLLLKAIYDKTIQNASNDKNLEGLQRIIEKCLWDIDFGSGKANKEKSHFKSEVATDKDKEVLESILQDTYTLPNDIDKVIRDKKTSAYERNYLYFVSKTQDSDITIRWLDFCQTLLTQCIVLPIECDGSDDEKKLENALRIFNTLNNRGMPLSDSDIFKGIIFKGKKTSSDKAIFAEKWKEIEESLKDNEDKDIDMNFIFRNYMHLIRARHKDSGNEMGLRQFFASDKNYKDILRQDATMSEIEELSKFWNGEYKDKLSKRSLQLYEVLEYIPNEYWKYLDSVYFMYCKDKGLDYFKDHEQFLAKLVANLLVKLINKQSLFEVRPIIFNAYASLYEKGEIDFKTNTKEILENEIFKNQFLGANSLIRSLLKLYLYLEYPEQEVGIHDLHIEHIFPQKFRADYKGWDKAEAKPFIESIGNKMWLDQKINIQASNDYFDNKKEKYAKSEILEAQELAKYPKSDWLKEDIEKRRDKIYEKLVAFFRENIGGSSRSDSTKAVNTKFQPKTKDELKELVDNLEINLGDIDTSLITDMSDLFNSTDRKDFSGIEAWDVSKVTNMSSMFSEAKFFNMDISQWDVSQVTDMSNMFSFAKTFNKSLNNWNVSNVKDMRYMFFEAKSYNQPMNAWNVSKVTDMSFMFADAKYFNSDISNWDVSNVTDMSYMFRSATFFNQPLNNWNVSKVTDMSSMFADTKNFNQPLNNWNVSNVDYMDDMFDEAEAYTYGELKK